MADRKKKKNKQKLFSMPWKVENYTSSLFVRSLERLEDLSYRRLLDCSWVYNEKPGYLPFNEQNNFKELVTATGCKNKDEFLQHWKVLQKKFKTVTYRGEKYIYNPELLQNRRVIEGKIKSGSHGGKKRAANAEKTRKEKIKQGKLVTFAASTYGNREMFAQLIRTKPQYNTVDTDHYYERVSRWAKNKAMRETWEDAIWHTLSRDEQEKKLLTINKNGKDQNHKTGPRKNEVSHQDRYRESMASIKKSREG